MRVYNQLCIHVCQKKNAIDILFKGKTICSSLIKKKALPQECMSPLIAWGRIPHPSSHLEEAKQKCLSVLIWFFDLPCSSPENLQNTKKWKKINSKYNISTQTEQVPKGFWFQKNKNSTTEHVALAVLLLLLLLL